MNIIVNMENDALENYIEKILKIEKEKSLTEEDFISIAKEIGLTDKDLVYILYLHIASRQIFPLNSKYSVSPIPMATLYLLLP